MRFQDQIEGKGWLLGRSGGRRGDGQSLMGRSRIHRVRVSLSLGLFVEVKRRR